MLMATHPPATWRVRHGTSRVLSKGLCCKARILDAGDGQMLAHHSVVWEPTHGLAANNQAERSPGLQHALSRLDLHGMIVTNNLVSHVRIATLQPCYCSCSARMSICWCITSSHQRESRLLRKPQTWGIASPCLRSRGVCFMIR